MASHSNRPTFLAAQTSGLDVVVVRHRGAAFILSRMKRSRVKSELPRWPEAVVGGKYVTLLQKHVDQLRETLPARSR